MRRLSALRTALRLSTRRSRAAVVKLPQRFSSASISSVSHAACVRQLSADASAMPIGEALDESWAEHAYLAVANATLEAVSEAVSEHVYASSPVVADSDVELVQGVLTLSLGTHGSYVLNTQLPNRQIWLSSPQSGPARFAWHPEARAWLSTRDGRPLVERLGEELRRIFDAPVRFDFRSLDKVVAEQMS